MSLAVSPPYRLEMPSDSDLLMAARMFAAAVADQTDFEDAAEDIKVAITEGLSLFIGNGPTARPVTLEIAADADRLRFTITGDGRVPDEDGTPREPLTGMDLVRALFPSVSLVGAPEGGTTMSFEVIRADGGG